MIEPRCLVCEEWVGLFADGDFEMPVDAVTVEIPGNHGSQVYDNVGGEILSAYLCDECLSVKIRNGFIDRIQIERVNAVRIRHPYTVPGD